MPQARSGGSRSSSSGRSTSAKQSSSGSSRSGGSASGGGATGRSSSPRSGGRASSAKSSSGGARASKSTSSASSSAAADARLEAAAKRLRKLNERIIEAGKGAGEGALASYEKALKAMASSIERGPGSSDVEWISNIATAQAKFMRDVTTAWTSAARDMLK